MKTLKSNFPNPENYFMMWRDVSFILWDKLVENWMYVAWVETSAVFAGFMSFGVDLTVDD